MNSIASRLWTHLTGTAWRDRMLYVYNTFNVLFVWYAYIKFTAYTVCPVNNQKFLSTDQSLLPPANIQATSEDTLFNPVENFIAPDSPPWCTAENEGTMPGHSIELTFTEPVVIELLQSSGFFNGYVNNFTILYTMSVTENDFNSYGILEQSQVCRHVTSLLKWEMHKH